MDSVATRSLESSPPPLVRVARRTLAIVGCACLTVAFGADWIVGGAPGFGRGQMLLLVFGLAVLIAAVVIRKRPSALWTLRGLTFVGSAYIALVACDLVLQLRTQGHHNTSRGLKGLYLADAKTGFRLSPNFEGVFDDGVTRCLYRTNSLGHRDDEPTNDGERRILLIGDSFAFGYGLDEGQTIDKWMEQQGGGRVDVYNAGIQAYGPPAILETLRRCDWYRGDEVVYLFFGNDLRSDNLRPDMGLSAFDGYQVPKNKEDDTPYTAEEYTRSIREILQERKPRLGRMLSAAVRLAHLRQLSVVRQRSLSLLDTQGPGMYRPESVATAVDICLDMAEVARARDMTFSVAILPTRGEVVHREHAELVASFMNRLRREGVRVIDLLGKLTPAHYYDPPDIHINPDGARQVAAGLGEWLVAE